MELKEERIAVLWISSLLVPLCTRVPSLTFLAPVLRSITYQLGFKWRDKTLLAILRKHGINKIEFRISTERVLPGLPGMIPRTPSIVLDPQTPTAPHTSNLEARVQEWLAQSLAIGTHHPRYNLETRSYRQNARAMLCLLGWSQQNGFPPGCCLLSKLNQFFFLTQFWIQVLHKHTGLTKPKSQTGTQQQGA